MLTSCNCGASEDSTLLILDAHGDLSLDPVSCTHQTFALTSYLAFKNVICHRLFSASWCECLHYMPYQSSLRCPAFLAVNSLLSSLRVTYIQNHHIISTNPQVNTRALLKPPSPPDFNTHGSPFPPKLRPPGFPIYAHPVRTKKNRRRIGACDDQ